MDSGIYACRTLVQDGSEGDVIIESQDHSNVTVIGKLQKRFLWRFYGLLFKWFQI